MTFTQKLLGKGYVTTTTEDEVYMVPAGKRALLALVVLTLNYTSAGSEQHVFRIHLVRSGDSLGDATIIYTYQTSQSVGIPEYTTKEILQGVVMNAGDKLYLKIEQTTGSDWASLHIYGQEITD